MPALKFTLSASESEPVRIPSIKIEGLLNTSEVTNLTLIIDINNNGVKDTSDIIYDKNKNKIDRSYNVFLGLQNSDFRLQNSVFGLQIPDSGEVRNSSFVNRC